MIWAFWFLLLVVQNAAFTLVSRARNSGSMAYHAIAAVGSNGVWYVSQYIMIAVVFKDLKGWLAVWAGAVYIAATVSGSVAMHWFSMRFIEKGKRRVGS